MKVSQVIREYRKSRAFRALADSSKKQYVYALEKIEDFMGDREIDTIRRPDFLRLMEKLSATPAIANRVARIASILFSYALDMDYVQGNPASKLKKNKLGTWVKWYPHEVQKVIDEGDRVVSTAVALAWYTGQRECDVLNMRWSDIINDTHIRVLQQKTKRHKDEDGYLMIEIHPDLREILARLDRTGDFIVFPDKPMTQSGFRSAFKRMIAKVGVDKNFHGIRKGIGSFLAELGVSTNEIAAFLGHSTLDMAALYTSQAEGRKMVTSAVRGIPRAT